jgi:protoheme IX farnesyltransferase
MGWTAVTGHIDPPGLVLFAIMFLWQIPHFVAIALFRSDDYAAAGIRTLPLVYGKRSAKMQAAAYAACLIPVALLLVPLHVAGPLYAITAVLLGIGYVAISLYGLRATAGRRWARTWFFASLIHLTGLFGVLIFEHAISA